MPEVAFVRAHDHDPHAAYAHMMAFARSQGTQTEAASPEAWGDALRGAVRSGGFTFHDMVGDGPTSGYMVSTDKGSETRIPIRDLTPERVADYMSLHQSELRSPQNFMGGWVYGGFVYLDISTHVQDRQMAMELARQHDQIAIYDVGRGESVTTERDEQSRRSGSVIPMTDRRPAYVRAEPGADPLVFINAIRANAGLMPMQRCAGCGETTVLGATRPYAVRSDGEPLEEGKVHDHWTSADETV